MFEPVRGGTRGGQAEFKWSDVSADKDREHYLGHSVNAPTGRWQKNKDVHWYNRDLDATEAERTEEIRKIKELEAQALASVLGYEPTTSSSTGPASGANAVAVPSKSSEEQEERKKEKAERRRLKEEKRIKKEQKRIAREGNDERPRRRTSRSASPKRRADRSDADTRRPRSRSRTPPRISDTAYGPEQRERERENDRRRWEMNTRRRDQPQDRRR